MKYLNSLEKKELLLNMNFYTGVSFLLAFTIVTLNHVECVWFKYALKEVNCDYADQGKCETMILWQGQCPICRKCYNVCPECRDRNMACKKYTTFYNPDCDVVNSTVYINCPKSCGHCKCERKIEDLPIECLDHFKRSNELQKKLRDEL